MARLKANGITTCGVVLDMCNMNDLDATTIQVLSDMQEKLAVRKIRFSIANGGGAFTARSASLGHYVSVLNVSTVDGARQSVRKGRRFLK